MPHTLPKPPKARKYVRLWNNRWHEGRMREVENLGYVEACKEKGIQVIDAKVSYVHRFIIDLFQISRLVF